jgi:GH24 family phage-related lysozyme (muramidase)
MSYVCKVEGGNAKIYNSSNGSLVRTICSGATSGVVSGDEAHITMSNGQVKIYNVTNGSLIRTI